MSSVHVHLRCKLDRWKERTCYKFLGHILVAGSERRKRQPNSMQYKTSYIVYIVLTNIEHFLSEFENKSETFCCMFQSVRQGIFCQGIQASTLGAEKGIRMC